MYSGTLYIISAPSGAGKTSLISKLLENLDQAEMAISHTTRQPREGEINGKHYHFVSENEFLNDVQKNKFLEHANVFGNHYGTSKNAADSLLQKGVDVILEIDWQGAQQVRKLVPEAYSIFILPPSLEELESRLRGRGTDSDEVIAKRLSQSRADIEHYNEFDYVVINDDFDQSVQLLASIFYANRARLEKQKITNKTLLDNLCL